MRGKKYAVMGDKYNGVIMFESDGRYPEARLYSEMGNFCKDMAEHRDGVIASVWGNSPRKDSELVKMVEVAA